MIQNINLILICNTNVYEIIYICCKLILSQLDSKYLYCKLCNNQYLLKMCIKIRGFDYAKFIVMPADCYGNRELLDGKVQRNFYYDMFIL